MRRAPVVLALFLATSTTGCGAGSWCQELVMGKAVFTGAASWFQREPIYVRFVATFDHDIDSGDVPDFVRVGAHTVRVESATPESLRDAGIAELTVPTAPFRQFGVRLAGTDAGILIHFHSGLRPRLVGMTCRPGDTCDFAVGWRGRPMLSLPATGSDLAARLPRQGVLRECVPAF